MSGKLRMREPATIGQEKGRWSLSPQRFFATGTSGQQDSDENIHFAESGEARSQKWSPWGALESGFQVEYSREKGRAPGGKARPDADVRRLEGEPQRELDLARNIVLAGYSPKIAAAAAAAIRRTELRVVEPVEELSAELGAKPLVWTKLSVLEDGEVKVFHPVSAYVRLGTRIGAKAVSRAVRKYGRIKPFGQPCVQGAGGLVR